MPAAPARFRVALVVALSAPLAGVGCGDERERPGTSDCTSWVTDVQSVVLGACGDCHGSDAPAGNYDLTSYPGALGNGSDDTPNALAGDPTSLLLTTLADDPDDPHRGFDEIAALLREWVVTCELSHRNSRVHAGGILNPRDDEFHGAEVARAGYDLGECGRCHGDDFSGGNANASCLDCHPAGPTDCATCHSDLDSSGAHAAHAGPGGAFDSCSDCHVVPDTFFAPGHVRNGDDVDPPPAEVSITAELAAATPPGAERSGPPTYDPGTGRCSNVYCHGAVFNDPAATLPEPTWTSGSAAADCQSCHGAPPTGHVDDRCAACHGAVVNASGEIIEPLRHVDGQVDLGQGCGDCHGGHGDSDGAPPPDLEGNESTDVITVGAHRAHVDGESQLRGPIPCRDCHLQPTEVSSPGHIDTAGPAEVFADPTGLAFADGATPSWTRGTATCAGVYCHGGGAVLSRDESPGLAREPVWTEVGVGADDCGTCHGVPPTTAPHDPSMAISGCTTCHPSVDGAGAPILTGPEGARTSLHIDGAVDVRPGCDGCHGSGDGGPPPDLDGNRSTDAITVGAHRAHIEGPSRLRGPIPCSDCHLQPTELRSPGHVDTARPAEVFVAGSDSLAFADGATPVWTRGDATCSGVYCHGGGQGLAGDTSPELAREPEWTAVGVAQDACGTCHGVPPTTSPHTDTMTIGDCADCHPSVDRSGLPILTGPAGARTSLHINGVPDVR